MPEPSRWGINTPVYRAIKSVIQCHPGLCGISPNVITVLGGLVTIPVVCNFLFHHPTWQLLVWAVLREVLDMADGQVASSCNTTSRTGAVLDVTMDAVYTLCVSAVLVFCVWPARTYVDKIIVLLAVLFCSLLGVDVYYEVSGKRRPFGDTIVVLHGVVLVPTLLVIIKLWIQRSRSAGGCPSC